MGNVLFITPPTQPLPFKHRILATTLKHRHGTTVVLVERIQELVQLQTDYLAGVGPLAGTKCTFLEGHTQLHRDGPSWTAAASTKTDNNKVLCTTTLSFLHALLHGFVGLQSVSTVVVVERVPECANQHALCAVMQLFYWPLVGRQITALGNDSVTVPVVVGFVEGCWCEGEDIFKRHQWAIKLCHYQTFFDAIVVGLDGQCAGLGGSSVMVSFEPDGACRDDILDATKQDPVELALTDHNNPISICNADNRFISLFASTLLNTESTDNNAKSTDNNAKSGVFWRANNRIKMATEALATQIQHHQTTPTGALLEPTHSVDILLRFCSSLAKPPPGKPSLSMRTVPVRLVDPLGKAVDTTIGEHDGDGEELQWFVCEITIPHRLTFYVGDPVVCGQAMPSRHEAQCAAAFKVCRMLLAKGLFDDHLLSVLTTIDATDSIDTIGTITDTVDANEEEEETNFNTFNTFNTDTTEIIDELVPSVMRGGDEWRGKYVYAVEWEWCGSQQDSQSLPTLTRWLSSPIDYMNTARAPIAFGLLLKERLPALPQIFIPTGSYEGAPDLGDLGDLGDFGDLVDCKQQGFVCRLRLLDIVVDTKGYDELMAMQPQLFSFLNVRPLFMEELLNTATATDTHTAITSQEPNDNRQMYMIVPLKRVGFEYDSVSFDIDRLLARFEALQSESFDRPVEYGGEWMIDYQFLAQLAPTDTMKLSEILTKAKEKYGDRQDYQVFIEYSIKTALLHTPYNGMFYRLRRLYDDLTPSSPFESKAVPEARTYWEYTKLRYPQVTADGDIDAAPLLGVNRVENFADVSTWTLPEEGHFETTQMAKDRKRLKLSVDTEPVDGKRRKTALIPWLTRVSRVPYGAIRALLVMPRVVGELESMLQCLDFYVDTAGVTLPDNVADCRTLIEGLTAVTAMQPYNYERLEVLGDSLLKAAVTVDTLKQHRSLGEGRLSTLRQSKINNANLFTVGRHHLAIHRYATLSVFSAKLWAPPALNTASMRLSRLERPMEWAQAVRLFDGGQRRRLFGEAERKRHERELVYDFDIINERLLSDPNNNTTLEPHLQLTRRGQPISGKTVADLVESSIGAIYSVYGLPCALLFLRRLGLIDDADGVIGGDGVAVMGVVGFDPSDRLACSVLKEDIVGTCASITELDHSLTLVEEAIGYKFKTKYLLQTAFTHHSVDSKHCNERLEWLGDAILDWIVTKHYHTQCPGMSPFDLTEARKATVNNVTLASLVIRLGWHQLLRHAKRSVFIGDVERHLRDPQNCPPPKAASDLLEAVIGSIYLDTNGDHDQCAVVVTRLLSDILSRYTTRNADIPVSAVSRCLEAYARLGLARDTKIMFTTNGKCVVEVRGRVVGESAVVAGEGKTGRAKALAKERAAQAALDHLLG